MNGPTLIALGDVGSTNDEALSRLTGEGPLWVTAERQLSGRGRRARQWVSEAGNLYASCAMRTDLTGDAFSALPLAAAVSLGEVLEGLGIRPELKWPNDVLIGGRKVSGILLESQSAGAVRTIVFGFGVNVSHHPSEVDATHLREHAPVHISDVRDRLMQRLAANVATLSSPGGVSAIREAWLSRAVGIGSPITVRLPAGSIDGRFEGLDDAGRLILDAGGTVHTIAAGDVFIHRERL